MEDLSREIIFKAFLSSKGNNKHRKLVNFYKSIGNLKQLAYSDFIKGMVKKKHNQREFFGYAVTNYYLNTVCDEDTN
jgi:hypothetical protein